MSPKQKKRLERLLKEKIELQAQHYYKKGKECIESGQHFEAVRNFREAIKLKPDFIEAHIEIASAWIEKYEKEKFKDSWYLHKAVKEIKKALKINPQYEQARELLDLLKRKEALRSVKEIEEQTRLKAAKKCLQEIQDLSIPFFENGLECIKYAEYDLRENSFESEINLGYAYYILGSIYFTVVSKAIKSLKFGENKYIEFLLYEPRAYEMFEKVIKLDLRDPKHKRQKHEIVALTYYKRGAFKGDNDISFLNFALEQSERNRNLVRGLIESTIRGLEAAEEDLDKAIDLCKGGDIWHQAYSLKDHFWEERRKLEDLRWKIK